MKLLRPILLLAGLSMTMAGASAQVSLTPPAAQPPASPPAAKKEAAPKQKAPPAAKQPTASPKPAATPQPAATSTPFPAPAATFEDPNADLVYGAYQRGLYKTAF